MTKYKKEKKNPRRYGESREGNGLGSKERRGMES